VAAAVWRQRLLVLIVWVVTAVATVVGVHVAPQHWTASALVQVDGAAAGSMDADRGGVYDRLRASLAATVTTAAVTEDASRAPGVDLSPDAVRTAVRAERVPGTVFVRVRARADDPRAAADLADAVADALTRVEIGERLGPGRPLEAEVVAPAGVPSSPSSPDLAVSLAVAALLAVGLGAAAAVARDRRTHRLGEGAEVEAAAAAPLLAHLSAPRDLTELPALTPGTVAAEAFRHLAWSVRGRGADPAPLTTRTVVADVVAGDGHVWVGANLAIALAQAGRRVLLTDGRMGERFGAPGESAPDTPGLYDVLTGVDLDAALSPGPVAGLRVLPPGTWGEEPVSGLLTTRFAAFLDAAAASFDDVVVLGPPLSECADSRLMAADAELVLTLGEGAVAGSALRAHADRLRASGARLLGVVLVSRSERRVG
jgi:Mrp family chromosome partitioning ATPase